jgi:hypothetical protein
MPLGESAQDDRHEVDADQSVMPDTRIGAVYSPSEWHSGYVIGNFTGDNVRQNVRSKPMYTRS